MFHYTPEPIIGETTFCKETVDMRISFKRTTEGVKDTDEAGYKVLRFV